ncbi:MAG: metallophosphoesterase family protein [Spirochaetes bacterium]|nr:metallophosphoesterase family protein [Spirochaetota bacterium]
MKILIIADIHSNLEALKETFLYIKKIKMNISRTFVLGDIIGYGPFPNECIDFVKNLSNCTCTPGNHEWALLGKMPISYFNENAKQAILWTKKVLTKNNRDYILYNLPMTEKLEYDDMEYLFLHGSPTNKIEEYIVNPYIAKKNFKEFDENVCFFAHTHVPMMYMSDKNEVTSLYLEDGIIFKLDHDIKYLINIGSIGQPRDGDPRASFGILDTSTKKLTIKRIDYDYAKTQKYIMKAGLPEILASRLAWGR